MSAGIEISEETIFALATPPGRSAIAVMRISGPRALDVPELFHVKQSKQRGVRFARLRLEDGSVLDEVMCLTFRAPASPTGEDILEIHCHGSPAVIASISAILAHADYLRPAEAGEFSRRALDNGKMGLTEVEGLADLIDSDTEAQRRQASRQMGGVLHDAASEWRSNLVHLNADLAAVIDFADEELPESLLDRLQIDTSKLLATLKGHLNDSHIGEIIRDGVHVALVGPVNAGKSTTLNALARRDAAIISDEAGTTRDVIEVRLDIDGVPVILRDTAGYRETDDAVEKEGIARARAAAQTANLVLLVIDISDPDWQTAYHAFEAWDLPDTILLANKVDKLGSRLDDVIPHLPDGALLVSLGSDGADSGLSELKKYLSQKLAFLQSAEEAPLITRSRHRQAIERAVAALESALAQNVTEAPELAAEDYRLAAEALGRITGAVDIEDLLDHIFSAFCIGK